MLTASTLVFAAVSGYVHAGSCAQQSTSAVHSPVANKSSLNNDYRILEDLKAPKAKIEQIPNQFVVSKTKVSFLKQAEETSKIVVEDFIKSMTSNVASSFSDRVDSITKNTSFNKSQLASILRVERKSIYDWKKKPNVNVREATRDRVGSLEHFISSMDEGHSQYIAKLAFGSHGHKDLAEALLAENIDSSKLESLYDKYWLEFDGFYTRAKIEEQTRGFDDLSGYGELV